MSQTLKTGTLLSIIVLAIILLLLALQQLAPLLVLLLIAVVFTTGISPMVEKIQLLVSRWWRMPRALATLLVLLFSFALIMGIFAFLIVTGVNEAIHFVNEIWPMWKPHLMAFGRNLSARYEFIPTPADFISQIQAQSGTLATYLLSTTRAIFGFLGGLFSAFTIVILTFFFTIFKDGISATFMRLVPPGYRARVRRIGHLAGQQMGGWLRGQLLLALIVTLITATGMWIFRMPYPMLIGLIAGLGEMIPMVGPYVAFFPALGIALATGQPLWVLVLLVIFFAALSQAENYVIFPKVMERHVGLHPVTTIIALFVGGTLLGLLGALLAIPLAAAGRVVMLEAVFPAIERAAPRRSAPRIQAPNQPRGPRRNKSS